MNSDRAQKILSDVHRTLLALFGLLIWCAPANTADSTALAPFRNSRFTLERGDVVAFVGGADVAAAQHTGHLEALLAVKSRGLGARFRNFGWEGDTVFAQPRDVGFPSLAEHLRRAGTTVIVLQFGRAEALDGREVLPRFRTAYQKLLDEFTKLTPQLVLVTPPPFENGGGLLPDLSTRNAELAEYAAAIRALASERGTPLVDLFTELGGVSHREPRLTDDGLQLTPLGHAEVARAFAKQLGLGEFTQRAGVPNKEGVWPNTAFERIRQKVVAKNKLWFNYWRPQNWAFLGGDRISQPSSRDHRDPRVRWFPAEMEKFVPLIEAKEKEIEKLAAEIHGGGK
ncbi:MAG: SGNH/GDSL hydrolase family protein [Verrucomicrobia bacterium]|nr:SGNH/GDSL hydrolase family protein [Verrucomicrobiota bacterium]